MQILERFRVRNPGCDRLSEVCSDRMIPIQMATARECDLPSRLAANPLLLADTQQEGLVMHDYTTGCDRQATEISDQDKVSEEVNAVLYVLNSGYSYYDFQPEEGREPDEDDFIDLEPVAKKLVDLHKRLGGLLPYEPGYVYAINAVGTNYFKFGKTNNPNRRLLEIAPKMPFETQFARVWPANFMSNAEKFLHSMYADCRSNGEWFLLDYFHIIDIFQDVNDYFRKQIRDSYATTVLELIQGGDDYHYEELGRFLHEHHRIFGYHGGNVGEADKVTKLIELCFTGLDYTLVSTSRDFLERAEQECIAAGDLPF